MTRPDQEMAGWSEPKTPRDETAPFIAVVAVLAIAAAALVLLAWGVM